MKIPTCRFVAIQASIWMLLLVGFSGLVVAQEVGESDPDWSVLMQNPDVTVDEVRALYALHWEGREKTQGSGYKQIERWLHLMEGRTREDGTAMGAAETLKAWEHHQAMTANRSAEGNWQVCGPVLDGVTTRDDIRGIGRMDAIAFHPTNPDVMFVGSPAGGLWRSYNGGDSWESNTDGLPTLGVSAVVFDHVNPDVVYIGTGDRDHSDSPGMGVMKSVDGGLTWAFANSGIEELTIGDMVMSPFDNQTLLAGTSAGIFRSTDAGETWIQESTNSQNYKDVAWHLADPEVCFATGQGRFWRSNNAGETWTYINDGIQPSTRMVIAVTPADPNLVYVLSTSTYEFRAFFKSTDGGLNFVEMSDSPNIMSWSASGDQDGGQAWYDLCMAADPVTVDRLYIGSIRMKRTDDGGATFQDIQSSFLHVDQHVLAFHPTTNELWLANDGGLYRYDQNQQWVDMSSDIITAQIYRIGQNPHAAAQAMNGYQDNGTYRYDGVEWTLGSGGDGFECQYDPAGEAWFYTSSQYGKIYRSGPGIQSQNIVRNGELGITEDGAWSTPFYVDSDQPEQMMVGLKNVWRSENIKEPVRDSIVWERISWELGGNNNSSVAVLHRSLADSNIVFCAKGSRQLYRTMNANADADSVVWTNHSNDLPWVSVPVTALASHPTDTARLYLGFDSRVWISDDLGESWEDHGQGLPEVRVNSVVLDTASVNEGLYAGTDIGVYYRDTTMTDWISFSNGLPLTARVTEVEIYYGSGEQDPSRLRAGTFGRGMWESDLYGADVFFPPLAYLTSTGDESSIFGDAVLEVQFRRNQETLSVEGFEPSDLSVSNAEITDWSQEEDVFTIELSPEAYGLVEVVVPGAVAVESIEGGLENIASDTLRLVYLPSPEPFGPWGPGGVGDAFSVSLWLRGDRGVTTEDDGVVLWEDVFGGAWGAAQDSAARRPIMDPLGIAGRPAVLFDGEDDFLLAEQVPTSSSLSAFSVARGLSNQWDEHGWIASAREPNGFILHPWKDQSAVQAVVIDGNGDYAEAVPYWIVDAQLPQLYGVIYDQNDWDQNFYTVINGLRIPFPNANAGARDEMGAIDIRYGWDFDDRYGSGLIAEHVIYNRRLFETHRTLLTNALGMRYGLSIGTTQRYFRTEFPEDLAGVGRESEWDLHEDGAGLSGVRVNNCTDLEDGEYLIWGHDGAPMGVSQPYPFLSDRLSRTWGYEQTGDVGAFDVRIYDDAGTIASLGEPGLIWLAEDEFTAGSEPTFIPLVQEGGNWTCTVDVTGSGVFTVGEQPLLHVSESMAEIGMRVFPNPASGQVTLQLSRVDYRNAKIEVLDLAGRLVLAHRLDGRNLTWDVSEWARGCYIVRVRKAGQTQSVPLMIR